jgi:voltage-gated potassium channel
VNGDRAALRQVRLALLVLLLLACGAVFFYAEIEGWPLLDALYMVAITVSTVGFGEIHPLSPGARAFNLFFISAAVITVAWAARAGGELVVQASVSGAWARRRLMRMLNHMSDHYIICGHGRMGREIARELRAQGRPFVVIEADGGHETPQPGMLYVHGDATEDRALIEAGVERASGLVAVTSTDEDNVFITLSARALNPNLFIVARSDSTEAEGKLLRAGADRVISPYVIGGRRMAHALLRPTLTDFLEAVGFMETPADSGESKLHISDIVVGANCHLDGRKLHHSDIHERCGAVIIGVRKRDGELHLGAPKHMHIGEGDVIVAVGTREQVAKLQALACTQGE